MGAHVFELAVGVFGVLLVAVTFPIAWSLRKDDAVRRDMKRPYESNEGQRILPTHGVQVEGTPRQEQATSKGTTPVFGRRANGAAAP